MSAPTGSGAAAQSATPLSTIAHELRQPLSTIESIAYYLTLVLPHGDEKVHEQLDRIQRLVEQTSWILTSAQQLADPTPSVRGPVDVEDVIRQAVAARFPSGDSPTMILSEDLPPAQADPALIDNLLMLIRSVSTKGHPVTVRTSPAPSGVMVEMETSAPGYRQETSLCPGAVLSLESARRMVDAHGGSLEIAVDPVTGIRLRLMLP